MQSGDSHGFVSPLRLGWEGSRDPDWPGIVRYVKGLAMILAGLHRILILASLIVPAGLFAAAAVQNRADVMREGEQELIRSAAVIDEHARKVFETGELVLAYVDDHVSGMSWE